MHPIVNLLDTILSLFNLQLFIYIVLRLLIHFRIINAGQALVSQILQVLIRINEPILSRVRRFLPKDLGIDLSPIIVFLAVYFLRDLINYYF